MQLSLSNGIFADLKLSENLKLVKRLGFSSIEFNMKSVKTENDTAIFQAKKLLSDLDLHCPTLHAATFPVTELVETHRAVYYHKISADFAHELGAEIMVIHSSIHRSVPPSQRKRLFAAIYGDFAPYAKKLGLRLALENLDVGSYAFGKDPTELNEVLDAIPGGDEVGITLDISHAAAVGNLQQLVDVYHERLLNTHISNPKHKPIKEQNPELNKFIESLKRYGYKGPWTIEINSKCTIAEIKQTKSTLLEILGKES